MMMKLLRSASGGATVIGSCSSSSSPCSSLLRGGCAVSHESIHVGVVGSRLPFCTLKSSKLLQHQVGVATAQFLLRPLPYELDALEPHISKQTLEFHYGKHHRAYVDNLNKQIEDTDAERNTLEELVKISYNNGNPLPTFNNAGQAWNHDFYWSSICPGGGGPPQGEVLELIERDFGSYEAFVQEFKKAGATQFGSGWVWLVLKDTKLEIIKTANALTPIIWNYIPLTVVDVWEHAYYLDYQNRRPDYLTTFMDHLISWEEVDVRLARAKSFVNLGEPTIPSDVY